jgi:hypothetical protein
LADGPSLLFWTNRDDIALIGDIHGHGSVSFTSGTLKTETVYRERRLFVYPRIYVLSFCRDTRALIRDVLIHVKGRIQEIEGTERRN